MMNPLTTLNPQFLEQLKDTSQLSALEFFFDNDLEDETSEKKLWKKPQRADIEEIKNNVIFEATMEKKGKTFGSWKSRHFLLTKKFLAYKKSPNSRRIEQIMVLDRVKLDCTELQEKDKPVKFGFRLAKNNQSAIIYTSNKETYEALKKELYKKCILKCFQDTYQIQKLIGKGSFGKVYLVKRRSDGQQFAAKMFFKDAILKKKRGKELLMNEINILRSLDHPRIMKLYEVHETMLSIFLITELLEGGELFQLLNNKKNYTENECALILRRIIEPLIYLHQNSVMHRDIKPENLILRTKSTDYDIVIADFGLAQSMDEKFVSLRCGTPGYCAPEILNLISSTAKYGPKCDVFSVGCVFYHLITGASPFAGKFVKEIMKFNQECRVPFDAIKIKKLSYCAQDLLQQMLERDPVKRPTFKDCLAHPFFDEGADNNDLILSFVSPSQVLLSSRDRSREKISQSSFNGSNSFVMGRSNIMKGHIETMQDINMEPNTISNQNLMLGSYEASLKKLNNSSQPMSRIDGKGMLSPPKPEFRKFKDAIVSQNLPSSSYSSIHSENLESSESEDEIPYPTDKNFRKVQTLDHQLKRLQTNGTVVNPFSQIWNHSQIYSNHMI